MTCCLIRQCHVQNRHVVILHNITVRMDQMLHQAVTNNSKTTMLYWTGHSQKDSLLYKSMYGSELTHCLFIPQSERTSCIGQYHSNNGHIVILDSCSQNRQVFALDSVTVKWTRCYIRQCQTEYMVQQCHSQNKQNILLYNVQVIFDVVVLGSYTEVKNIWYCVMM